MVSQDIPHRKDDEWLAHTIRPHLLMSDFPLCVFLFGLRGVCPPSQPTFGFPPFSFPLSPLYQVPLCQRMYSPLLFPMGTEQPCRLHQMPKCKGRGCTWSRDPSGCSGVIAPPCLSEPFIFPPPFTLEINRIAPTSLWLGTPSPTFCPSRTPV